MAIPRNESSNTIRSCCDTGAASCVVMLIGFGF
jgi:hypothetical protein